MAQTITILAQQSRNSITAIPANGVTLPAGAPRNFIVNILSSDWQTIGAGVHQLDIVFERSFDGGATWTEFGGGATLQSGPVKGGGVPGYQGSWDGQASLARIGHVIATVNGVDNVAFGWGLSVTV